MGKTKAKPNYRRAVLRLADLDHSIASPQKMSAHWPVNECKRPISPVTNFYSYTGEAGPLRTWNGAGEGLSSSPPAF